MKTTDEPTPPSASGGRSSKLRRPSRCLTGSTRRQARFRAIIFDMDGVLVDSEPLHKRAFEEVFEALGYGENHGMDFAAYYGRSDRAMWLDFIAKHRPRQSLEELVAWKYQRFTQLLREAQPVFAPVRGLLESLAPHYTLAVASGSPRPVIDLVLTMQGLGRFFQVAVSAHEVVKGKPAPDVFLRTAALLEMPPAACCVIEDAAAGVEAARAAGMSVVAITNSLPREKLSRATRVVDTYEEIGQWLAAGLLGRPLDNRQARSVSDAFPYDSDAKWS